MHHGGGEHLDSCDRCTSMKLVMVSGIVSAGKLYLPVRHHQGLHGHAVATTASAVRESHLVLPFRVGLAVPPP